jgi:hypothetical protein
LQHAKNTYDFLAWAHDPKNAEATPEQAQEERQRIERPGVENRVKAALGVPTSKIIVTQAEYDALEKGEHYRDSHDVERVKQ